MLDQNWEPFAERLANAANIADELNAIDGSGDRIKLGFAESIF